MNTLVAFNSPIVGNTGSCPETLFQEIACDLPQSGFWPDQFPETGRLPPGAQRYWKPYPKVIIAATHGPRSGDKTRTV